MKHGPPTLRDVVDLIQLRGPIVATLHAILAEPSPARRAAMDEPVRLSARIVVMSERGAEFLRKTQRPASGKIASSTVHTDGNTTQLCYGAAATCMAFAGSVRELLGWPERRGRACLSNA